MPPAPTSPNWPARRPATGVPVRRPGTAAALQAIATQGRDGFYGGAFGDGLLQLGNGWFTADDLADPLAEWVTPLRAEAWGVELWTDTAELAGLPGDRRRRARRRARPARRSRRRPLGAPADRGVHRRRVRPGRACCTTAPTERHSCRECAARGALVDPERASTRWAAAAPGGTTYLCSADESCAVSMIQSNASGFGSWLVEPHTQINLHDRGLGFHLGAGHPAEHPTAAAGRRTPCCRRWRRASGRLDTVFGSMGGDAQPQIVLQLAARLFRNGQSPSTAVSGGSLGAARTGDRVRHVDRARRPDGLDRGPRRTRLGRRARSSWPSGASRRGLRQRLRARSRHPSRGGRRVRRCRRSTRPRRRCCGSMN